MTMDIMPAISTMSLIRIYIACCELAISFKTHFCCRLACVNLAAFYLNTLYFAECLFCFLVEFQVCYICIQWLISRIAATALVDWSWIVVHAQKSQCMCFGNIYTVISEHVLQSQCMCFGNTYSVFFMFVGVARRARVMCMWTPKTCFATYRA